MKDGFLRRKMSRVLQIIPEFRPGNGGKRQVLDGDAFDAEPEPVALDVKIDVAG